MTQVARDAGLSRLIKDEITPIAEGFQFTEGPLWLPEGGLLFQDLKASKTFRWDPSGTVRMVREHTRGANGQTLDPTGRVIFCEQDGRRLSGMQPDGSGVETLVERFENKRLNSPNDLIVGSDGKVFFTDPAYGVPTPADKELPFQGVFQLDLNTRDLRLLASDGFEKPNGLALSPDGGTLFVNDTAKYHVRRLRLRRAFDGDTLIDDTVFASFDPAEPGGPDGLKLDHEGRLFVAVAEGIWVLDANANLLGILRMPKRPSNLAWGDHDHSTLYITAIDQVWRVRLATRGVVHCPG